VTQLSKISVLDTCREKLRQKMHLLSVELEELRESLSTETKSSMGDKHETSRSRMQADFEKFSFHLAEIQDQYRILNSIEPGRHSMAVAQDSLVFTSQHTFFLTVPLGKINVNGEDVFVISKDSPIGAQLLGKKINASFIFNGVSYLIKDIK